MKNLGMTLLLLVSAHTATAGIYKGCHEVAEIVLNGESRKGFHSDYRLILKSDRTETPLALHSSYISKNIRSKAFELAKISMVSSGFQFCVSEMDYTQGNVFNGMKNSVTRIALLKRD